MSRTIEQDRIESGDLSEEEFIYLAQRDQLPEGVRAKAEAVLRARKLLANSPPPVNEVANTGTVNTVGITRQQLEDMGLELLEDGLNPPEQFDSARMGDRAPGAPEPTEGTAQPLPDDGEEVDEEDDEDRPYSAWTKRELTAELYRRNEDRDEESQLAITGTKDELVAELERDDQDEA